MVPGSAWTWIAVNAVQQFSLNKKMKTKHMTTLNLRTSIGRSPWRGGFLLIPLALVCFALSASLALADDFKTFAGKEYKDATVTRVEPDGILVKYKSGISKLYFAELPKEVQERFHYDPQIATAYTAAQAAVYEGDAKQQEEARHRQEDAGAQKNAMIAKQQTANDRAQASQDREMASQQAKQQPEAAHTRRQKYPTLYQVPVVHSQPSTQNHQSKQPKQPTHE
jgi:hypothetical protein